MTISMIQNVGITVRNLSKLFSGQSRAVDHVNLDVKQGEFFSLLGPSGCGKSTLLRMIAGLELPTEGSIGINGRDVTRLDPRKRGIAMVFQDYALFPSMSVSDNITYAMRVQRADRHRREEVAQQYAQRLGLDELLTRKPAELSGGQQQRVALARAMAASPDVLLLDEPLSNLDARLRLEARTMLKRFQQEAGITTIFVTHDQSEALALSDRMAVMKHGVIQQIGTPFEVFHKPANDFVARFIGMVPTNMLEATCSDSDDGNNDINEFVVNGGMIALDHEQARIVADRRHILIGIRPDYLRWVKDCPDWTSGIRLRVRALLTENAGATTVVHCVPMQDTDSDRQNGTLLRVCVSSDEVPALGDEGWLFGDSRHIMIFDADTRKNLAADLENDIQ